MSASRARAGERAKLSAASLRPMRPPPACDAPGSQQYRPRTALSSLLPQSDYLSDPAKKIANRSAPGRAVENKPETSSVYCCLQVRTMHTFRPASERFCRDWSNRVGASVATCVSTHAGRPARLTKSCSAVGGRRTLAWRRDAEAGPMALRITKQGPEAIEVKDDAVGAATETSVSLVPDQPKWSHLPSRLFPPASGLPLIWRRNHPRLPPRRARSDGRNKPTSLGWAERSQRTALFVQALHVDWETRPP
jgi:hypothetical protein